MIRKIRISCFILLIGMITATGCARDLANQKEEQTKQMTDSETEFLKENENVSEENKKNIYEELANQMIKGDFSGMRETNRISREDAQNVYKNMGEKTEFILVDMNHDGVDDLVWQEKEAREIGNPIIAIFDMNNQGSCEMWDTTDGTEYFFVTEKGNLVYYAPYFGAYCYVPYWKYEYDEAWNRTKLGGICAYDIYDLEELEGHVLEDMEEEGIYFWEYIGEEKVALTRDEFKERFEDLTGADYECLVGISDMSWLQEESSVISNVEESEAQEEKFWERTETDEEQVTSRYANSGTIEVTMERIDKSVYDEQGRVIATIYYDKPVISGNTEAVARMNSFFENEVQSFIGNGESQYVSENEYEAFLEDIEFMKERYGIDSLAEHPITYVMNSRISYLDENILSIMQIRKYSAEHTAFFHLGYTFDLSTGEVMPVTDMVDITPEEMRKIFDSIMIDDEYKPYEELKGNNFIVTIDSRVYDMKYQYIYDGKYCYLIESSGGGTYIWCELLIRLEENMEDVAVFTCSTDWEDSDKIRWQKMR